MQILAVDIGGTKFTVAAFSDGRLLLRESRRTDRDGGPEWMFSQIEGIFRHWQASASFHPQACGIGFGGPVDFASQSIRMSTHVGGWANYPLLSRIEQLTGKGGVVDNDANVGALGECRYGAGRGFDPLFYMTLSTGIGGGILIDGEVYRGADSFAGELGHMNVVPDGPECLCGSRGCFERMCCGLWLERDHGRPAEQLFEQPEFVSEYVVQLARGLKAALMILNPARIVIGGGISRAGERLFGPLRAELNRQITGWSHARRDIVPAELGDDSVLYGCVTLVERHLKKLISMPGVFT